MCVTCGGVTSGCSRRCSSSFHAVITVMTVSSPGFTVHQRGKRKHEPDYPQSQSPYAASSPSTPPVHEEMSPRVVKKLRPKPINQQSLKGTRAQSPCILSELIIAKTVRELFQGQERYGRGEVDIEMTVDDAGHCSFCEASLDISTKGEEEYLCLSCGRTVCGKCGVMQYLSQGDYIACLDCVHQG